MASSRKPSEGDSVSLILEDTDLTEVIENFVKMQVEETLNCHQAEIEIEIEQEVQCRLATIAQQQLTDEEVDLNEWLLEATLTETLQKLINSQAAILANLQTLMSKNAEFQSDLAQLTRQLGIVEVSVSTNVAVNQSQATNLTFIGTQVSSGLDHPSPLTKTNLSSQTGLCLGQTKMEYGCPPLAVPSTTTLLSSLFRQQQAEPNAS